MLGKVFDVGVKRQQALHIYLGMGAALQQGGYNFADVIGNNGVGNILAYIVNAYQQKDLAWLTCYDVIKSFQHPVGNVAADAPVYNSGVARKLCPGADLGYTIAQKNNSAGDYGLGLKFCDALGVMVRYKTDRVIDPLVGQLGVCGEAQQ